MSWLCHLQLALGLGRPDPQWASGEFQTLWPGGFQCPTNGSSCMAVHKIKACLAIAPLPRGVHGCHGLGQPNPSDEMGLEDVKK